MYYKNKNVSYSQKIINPVIKYKKEFGSNEQRIYKGNNKKTLLQYIKKEGDNFESKKQIKENEGLKHLIISPIKPELYDGLNNNEKIELENIIKKQLFKDLGKFGFVGGLEHKARQIDGQNYDHFHVHIGINEKYDISPKNIDYLKRSITRSIESNPNLKEKLGLKNTKEIKKETWNNKFKKQYEKRKNNYEELKIYFNDLKNIGGEIKDEYNNIKEINWEIGELTTKRKKEINTIERNKEFLKNDIIDTKESLKQKNKTLKNINNKFGELYKDFNNEKDNIKLQIKTELNNLQNILNNELSFFKTFVNNDHNIYIQFLKYQKKNKIIDLPTFLYLVAVNKYYTKQRIKWKQNEIKERIKQREKELNKKLDEIKFKLEYKKRDLEWDKKHEENLKKYDENNLKKLFEQMKELNKDKKNIIDNSFQKIELLIKYKENRKKQIQQLQEEKLKKEIQLHKKQQLNKLQQQKINNINTINKQQKQTPKTSTSPTTKRKRNFKFGM